METQTAMDTNPDDSAIHDLPRVARLALGMKPAWTQQSEDLSVNLISCTADQGVGSHVNTEVDVLVVGIDGDGSVEIDGHWHALRPGQVVVIAKGARRATQCNEGHFAYLTCHRRRSALWPVVHNDGNTSTRGEQS